MRKLFLFTTLFLSNIILSQIPKISIEKIGNYVGETVTVCETVKSTFKTLQHKHSLINLGDSYPDEKLTVLIKQKHLKNFSYVPVDYLNGKTICVTGTVYVYRGKPQIKVKKEVSIVVL